MLCMYYIVYIYIELYTIYVAVVAAVVVNVFWKKENWRTTVVMNSCECSRCSSSVQGEFCVHKIHEYKIASFFFGNAYSL